VTLFVNGDPVGSGRTDHSVPLRFSGYAGLDIGRDNGMPVDRSYANRSPFPFTGTVEKVVFDVNPHLTDEDEAALHHAAHHGALAHGMSA
jgi:arylsulfatase